MPFGQTGFVKVGWAAACWGGGAVFAGGLGAGLAISRAESTNSRRLQCLARRGFASEILIVWRPALAGARRRYTRHLRDRTRTVPARKSSIRTRSRGRPRHGMPRARIAI